MAAIAGLALEWTLIFVYIDVYLRILSYIEFGHSALTWCAFLNIILVK